MHITFPNSIWKSDEQLSTPPRNQISVLALHQLLAEHLMQFI